MSGLDPIWLWMDKYTPLNEDQIMEKRGFPFEVNFRFVKADTLKNIKAATQNYATVMNEKVLIEQMRIEHEWMKDVNLDSNLPEAMDLWKGNMTGIKLINIPSKWIWENKYNPFFVQQKTTAHDGSITLVRPQINLGAGKPLTLKFRFVSGSYLKNLLNQSDPFIIQGENVLWGDNPAQVENEYFKNVGLNNSIVEELDYWRGSLGLISVGI